MATQYENQPVQGTGAMDVGERIDELRAELTRLTTQVQDYMQTRAAELRRSAADATYSAEKLIRDNPLPAVGIALAVGFVLALLARSGQYERRYARRYPRRGTPRLTRRDLDRLASRLSHSLMSTGRRAREAAAETGDTALLERLAGALSGMLESSKETMASVGSAGARSVAAMGEKTARSIADRLSTAAR